MSISLVESLDEWDALGILGKRGRRRDRDGDLNNRSRKASPFFCSLVFVLFFWLRHYRRKKRVDSRMSKLTNIKTQEKKTAGLPKHL